MVSAEYANSPVRLLIYDESREIGVAEGMLTPILAIGSQAENHGRIKRIGVQLKEDVPMRIKIENCPSDNKPRTVIFDPRDRTTWFDDEKFNIGAGGSIYVYAVKTEGTIMEHTADEYFPDVEPSVRVIYGVDSSYVEEAPQVKEEQIIE